MSDIRILKEFKTQLLLFFDELIDQFPEEGDLVVLRIFLDSQIPIVDIITIFNREINDEKNNLKKMIKDRNDNFFLEHNIFDFLGKDKVNHFKNLWQSPRLTSDIKDTIWKWIDVFVYLGDKYAKTTKV